MKFLMDRDLAVRLQRYLPIEVDYDDRLWFGIRVRVSRQGGCC